jgi:hypothetical protein
MEFGRFVASIVAGFILLGASLQVQAAPMTWTLNGVTFSDGTVATGYFVYDTSIRNTWDINISTSDGSIAGNNYTTDSTWFVDPGPYGPNSFMFFRTDSLRYLNFSFLNPLTDAGGTVELNTEFSWECNNCDPYRMVVAGSVTAQGQAVEVPEPGTLALMLPALGLAGLLRRRRKGGAA